MSDHPTPAPRAPEAERPEGTKPSGLPDWWPECPYPESVFPLKNADISRLIPDKDQRTAISGYYGRLFWHITSKSIFESWKFNRDFGPESRARAAEEELERVRGAMAEICVWALQYPGGPDLEADPNDEHPEDTGSHLAGIIVQIARLATKPAEQAGAAHPTQGEERT